MKKFLLVTLTLAAFAVSCGSKVEEVKEDAKEVAAATVEGAKDIVEGAADVYADFINEVKEKYTDFKDFSVDAYAKGIDLVFTTDKEDFNKEEFEKMANEVVASLKSKFTNIDKDAPVKVVLNYQKDANENAKQLAEVEVK